MNKFINPGGINGIGTKQIDPTTKAFKQLQAAILAHSKTRTSEEQLRNKIIGVRLRMETYLQANNKEITPAGSFLKELVQLSGVKSKDFAAYIDFAAPNLSAIYKGRRKLSLDLALRLEQIFTIPASLWLSIEIKNEIQQGKELAAQSPKQFSLEDLLKKRA